MEATTTTLVIIFIVSHSNFAMTKILEVDDRIKVQSTKHSHTSHHGRTATILKINKDNYTVAFDDNRPGKFVRFEYATKIPHEAASSKYKNDEDDDDDDEQAHGDHDTAKVPRQLARMLDQCAFTVAMLITSNYHDDTKMVQAVTYFIRAVKGYTDQIAQTRRDFEAAP